MRVRLPFVVLLAAGVFLGAQSPRADAEIHHGNHGFLNDVVHIDEAARKRARSHTKMATARFIRDEGDFAIIELAGDYDRDLAVGGFNIDPRIAVAEAFYQNHDDEYDFLVVFSGFEFATPGARAFYLSIQNDVEGIGQDLFDNAALFGSDRLQGYIDMAAFTRYELDSLEADFDSTLDTLVHEIMHRWGVYPSYRDGAGALNQDWLGFQDAHWSQYVDSGASVMGGAEWRDNGDGSFTALDIRRGYGEVDLYLGGFLEPDPAASLFYIRNPDGDPDEYWPTPGDQTGGIAEQVTIQQIIDAEGPRVPSADQSQREFRAGFIFLTRPGTFPSDELLFGLNEVRTAVTQRFSVETRGVGVMKTGLAESSGLAVSDPVTVQGGPAANGLADFAAAADWLLAAQDANGYWEDKPETRLRDTAVALLALDLLEIDDPGLLLGRNWIRNQSPEDNDDRAWILASGALDAAGSAGLLDELLGLRNPDGGWGLAPGDSSSSYDTALILAQLEGNEAGSASTFLQGVQRAGGGWGALSNGSNQVVTTALSLQALVRAGTAIADLADAATWLAGRQLANGTFGEGTGSPHETALALNALGLFPATPAAVIDTASTALEGLQGTDGSWAGSVYSTALALDALRNRQNPNLSVTGTPLVSPASPRDGDLVAVSFTVTNAGLFNTPAVQAQVFLGDPDAGGAPVSPPLPVPPLAPGEDFPLETFWDTLDQAGSRQLVIWVDSAESLAESSENDNRISLDVTVGAPPAQADLAVLANSLNFSPTVVGSLPVDFQADVTVRNLGGADAAGVTVSLQRRLPGGVVETLASQSLDLPARTSAPLNLAAQLTRSGPIELRIAADPQDVLAEPEEDNNVLDFDVATADALDLAVLPAEILLLTPTPVAGQDVSFQFTLR
ncbi:MAG: CARDB domain-containing protein, partial [Xanthomonadales bacterium]|nr:CARDB domain-containing protein [Xanthomonadales bacterium]